MDQYSLQQLSCEKIRHWIQQGWNVPNNDYNKAMRILQQKFQSKSPISYQLLTFSLCAIEDILCDALCRLLTKYFNIEDKINTIKPLNKYWQSLIGAYSLKDLCSLHLNIQNISKIITDQRCAIYLNQNQYKWSNFGYNKKYWKNIWKSCNTPLLEKGLSNFTCTGCDAIWTTLFQQLQCFFILRGWICDDDNELVVIQIGETILRGIRPQEEEYEESTQYESPDSDHEEFIVGSTSLYKARNLIFLNKKPKIPWSIIRHENGWYESKLDFYLILEIYTSHQMQQKLRSIQKDLINTKIIDLT